VVGAADAAVLHEPVPQRRAAVRAVRLHAAVAAVRQAEHHQLLAQDRDRPGGLRRRQLGDVAHGLPVAPQQRAAGRARPHLRQQRVLFGRQHTALLRGPGRSLYTRCGPPAHTWYRWILLEAIGSRRPSLAALITTLANRSASRPCSALYSGACP